MISRLYLSIFFQYPFENCYVSPQIKVVDCTIRDGGLMNNWRFPKPMVKEVFHGLAEAGVDYVEMGYRVINPCFRRRSMVLGGSAMRMTCGKSPRVRYQDIRHVTWADRL